MKMIRHVRHDDFVDSQSLQDITQQIRDYEVDNFDNFLEILPPVNDMINAIPRSLPLLDAIYSKCESFDDKYPEVFKRYLNCDQMMNKIIWWIAQMNQIGNEHVNNKNWTSPRANAFQYSILKSHLKSILYVIQRENIDVIKEIVAEKNQLNACLEALGCHGLINCNTGMIRLVDALVIETVRQYERLKNILSRLKDIQKHKMTFWDESPTQASHQRQLNLKLSEIFDRLKQNELIESILDDILSNNHLLSLHRIVKKRVKADRNLINVFNSYNNTKPDGFQIVEMNPIVAKMVVVFKNAYTQLTSLLPVADGSDSGYHYEDSEPPLSEDYVPDESTKSSISLTSSKNETCAKKELMESDFQSTKSLPDDARWITLSIYSSFSEIETVVQKFSNLFHEQRTDILNALNELPEFYQKRDLQQKTIFSVVVLTYRSVFDTTQTQYRSIYDTLGYSGGSDVIMDFSIYRLLYKQAKSDHGMSVARDVTMQIWETLYDFTSLKTCTRFNRFILDCVDVIWDIVAGIDGRLPRIKIEYESYGTFDDKRHTRHESSSTTSNAIKYCLWPGLVTLQNDQCILKTVVMT